MQFLLVLLPFISAVSVEGIQNTVKYSSTISDEIVKSVEEIRDQMPCGFEKYGIPPLAPFEIAHRDIDIDNDAMQVTGEINNFRTDGLNEFDIIELRALILFDRLYFKFLWHNITLNTDYILSICRGCKTLKRSGPAKLSVQNFTTWGVVKYKIGIFTGDLTVKEVNMHASLDKVKSEVGGLSQNDLLNTKLNRIIEEWFRITITDDTKLTNMANGTLVPMLNDMLQKESLEKGSATFSSRSVSKESCVPSKSLRK